MSCHASLDTCHSGGPLILILDINKKRDTGPSCFQRQRGLPSSVRSGKTSVAVAPFPPRQSLTSSAVYHQSATLCHVHTRLRHDRRNNARRDKHHHALSLPAHRHHDGASLFLSQPTTTLALIFLEFLFAFFPASFFCRTPSRTRSLVSPRRLKHTTTSDRFALLYLRRKTK